MRHVLLALILGLGTGFTGFAQTSSPASVDSKRIEELVKQLGSSRFMERDRAQKELEALGVPALEALRRAAREGDLETSQRASEMVRKLEQKITTDSLLSPKKVRLDYKDVPVLDAVADLAKKTGYVLQIEGDRAALANRKITLQTEEISFWEALDQLCTKAGLVEKNHALVTTPYGVPRIRTEVRPVPPIKVRPLPAPAPKLPAPGVLPVVPEKNAQPDKPGILDVPAQIQVQPVQVQAVPQVQIQIQGGGQVQIGPAQIQVQAVQIDATGLVPIGSQPRVGTVRQIILANGQPANMPTSYAGAVRVRLLPPDTLKLAKNAGETVLVFEACAEPRLQGFQILGNPSITRMIDDQGQTLSLALDTPQAADPNVAVGQNMFIAVPRTIYNNQTRPIPVRVKLGEKQARLLKEVSGTMTAQVQLPPEPLLVLDNVLQAKGQTAKGKNESTLTLQNIEKINNNEYRVQISMENTGGQNPFGGGVQIIGNVQVQIADRSFAGNQTFPDLLDAQGKAYQVAQVPNRSMQFNNGNMRQNLTVVYRANAGQGEPARLVQNGSRTTNIAIPFSFKDVPIP